MDAHLNSKFVSSDSLDGLHDGLSEQHSAAGEVPRPDVRWDVPEHQQHAATLLHHDDLDAQSGHLSEDRVELGLGQPTRWTRGFGHSPGVISAARVLTPARPLRSLEGG